MSSADSQFFDHGTFSGKMHGMVYRIREVLASRCSWKCIPTVVMFVLIATLVWLAYVEQLKENPALIESANGTISFKGNQINFFKLSADFYNQLNNSTIPIAVMNIENAIVVATELSNSVKKLSNSLLELYLNNVTIIGQFHRVHLPNLRTFALSQVIDAERLEAYQEKEYVQSVLFFGLAENELWEMENISNLGVNVI